MNKSELIAVVAENTGIAKKDADRIVNATLDIITKTLADGEKVQLSGFGNFETKSREPRIGRNPHTREAIDIPATRVPTFKPSRILRNIIGK